MPATWSDECEQAVNRQILVELQASYSYLALGTFFGRSVIGLFNVSKYFLQKSMEERQHADKFIQYQLSRGGNVELQCITAPDPLEPGTADDLRRAMKAALEMEEQVYSALLRLHKVADDQNDAALTDFVDGSFLHEQLADIHELTAEVTKLDNMGEDQHARWHYDQMLQRIYHHSSQPSPPTIPGSS